MWFYFATGDTDPTSLTISCQDNCDGSTAACNIVRNGVAGRFTPIATTNKIGEPHKCHRQNDIFPIINLPKIIAEKLDKIKVDYTKIF